MNKDGLISQIHDLLAQELNTLLNASDQAHRSATHRESKAENKYDTLGLEAAYLAHGLSLRAQQLQQTIAAFQQWQPPILTAEDAIALGAVVTLQSESGSERWLLLAACGGGLKVHCGGVEVTVVTTEAPLGKALLGKRLDDEVVLDVGGVISLYHVVKLA
ncbi:MAG: transcription elongation GreA/GreB family factor [Motiliproteus sp.]|jgi:transcription elongation GreA/GreB family factor